MTREQNAVFYEIRRGTPTESVASIGLEVDEHVPTEDNIARFRINRKQLGDNIRLNKSDQGSDLIIDLPTVSRSFDSIPHADRKLTSNRHRRKIPVHAHFDRRPTSINRHHVDSRGSDPGIQDAGCRGERFLPGGATKAQNAKDRRTRLRRLRSFPKQFK
jgi:hypothetical protein